MACRVVAGATLRWAWTERRFGEDRTITGPQIKAAFETFERLSTGGLTAPISFTHTDHRPTSGARIYGINEHGTLEYQDDLSIDLEADWVGW